MDLRRFDRRAKGSTATAKASVLAVLFLVSGCAGMTDDAPYYQTGYADGCNSANNAGTPGTKPQRDETLYAMEESYRAGWAAGYRDCRGGAAQRP
jgi:hypothetical protein